MQPTNETVIVVIATYNEAPSIGVLLDDMRSYQVIVVDDSSPDGTGELAGTFDHVQLISRPRRLGIASAYFEGFASALRRNPIYVVQMDAGMTHKPKDISRLIEKAETTGSDLVIGSRFGNVQFLGYRTLLSRGATVLMRLLGIRVNDATSGFRCWKATHLKLLDRTKIQADGFAFQLETLFYTHRMGGRIGEVPIEYLLTNSSLAAGILLEATRSYWNLFLTTLSHRLLFMLRKTPRRPTSSSSRGVSAKSSQLNSKHGVSHDN